MGHQLLSHIDINDKRFMQPLIRRVITVVTSALHDYSLHNHKSYINLLLNVDIFLTCDKLLLILDFQG
jgi:hypothetical protein